MSEAPVSSPVIAVVGPTASGKSEVAFCVARAVGGEIVSADSMAVYRGMDIGTAKPGPYARRQVPHHLIDVVSPDAFFSAARYQELSRKAIDDIRNRDRRVVLAGGTGLYVRAALDDLRFPGRGSPPSEVEEAAGDMFDRLQAVSPTLAAQVDPENPRRIRRAIDIASSGEDVGVRDIKSRPGLYEVLMYGLRLPRPVLVGRIEARVDKMIEDGLIEEVVGLTAGEHGMSVTARQALGYKEIIAYLEKEIALADAVEAIKTRTRQLAKRQMTWFRADKRVRWLDLSGDETPESVAEYIVSLARKSGFIVC